MSNSVLQAIKIGYVVVLVGLLLLFIQSSFATSFKFFLASLTTLGFVILLVHSAVQKRSPILYGAIMIFAFLFFLNLAFLAGSIMNKDMFVMTLDDISNVFPIVYLLCVSCIFYLIMLAIKGWNTSGEQRLVKIFLGFLIGFLVVDKVISLSLGHFANPILAVVCFLVFSELVIISVRSLYPKEES